MFVPVICKNNNCLRDVLIDSLQSEKHNLIVLYGDTRYGKTCICCLSYKAFLESGYKCKHIGDEDLKDFVKKSFLGDKPTNIAD